jgi:hypothetical protein
MGNYKQHWATVPFDSDSFQAMFSDLFSEVFGPSPITGTQTDSPSALESSTNNEVVDK